jgi:signal transduction histidine kinase
MLPSLIAQFFGDADRLLNQAHQALEQGRAEDVRIASHSLISTSATFGAMALSAVAREVESLACEDKLERVAELLDRAEAEFAKAKTALEAMRLEPFTANQDTNTGKGRILVVDDEMLNRVLLSTNLRESGYFVEMASDGLQALQLLRTGEFDAVLLDLIMPRMDGYQVLAEMRSDALLRRIPVIVISSIYDMESIVRCIEMGATDYLAKPFNPVLLQARIRGSLASLQEERMEMIREQFAQVTAVQEEERQRIARELHDGLVPVLASLSIRLHTVGKRLDREEHPAAGEVKEIAEQAQASSRDIRHLIHDLRPVALDELGLVPALRQHLARCEQEHGLAINLIADERQRLAGPMETALFRIVQEAVNNVIQHAQAQHVSVTLDQNQEQVTLQVVDNGQGFNAQLPRSGRHVGLWSMRERVEQLGGQFEVRSAPGKGTVVTAVIPL